MTNPTDEHKDTSGKNTDDLSGIKDVQKEGMLEKGKQVEQTPDHVKGADQGQYRHPQKR